MESLSNKGKRCFIHENNKFRSYRKDQQGNEYWRCTINRCIARLKTSTVVDIVELISNHAHANTFSIYLAYCFSFFLVFVIVCLFATSSGELKIFNTVQNEAVQILRTACKRKATDTACERPSKVIYEQFMQRKPNLIISPHQMSITCELRCVENDANTKEHYHAMSTRLSINTLKQLPIYTSKGEDFLCCCETTDDGGGFVILSTRSSLETLCEAGVITVMDETFSVCPKFFHQLYTIHGFVHGHYIPLVH